MEPTIFNLIPQILEMTAGESGCADASTRSIAGQ
jgi:hypothetical protein